MKMQNQTCDLTQTVARAITSGDFKPDLLEHAIECETCRDLWIADGLRERSRHEASHSIPPIADMLWWKAQLQQGQCRPRRIGVPLTAAQAFAFLGGLVALFVVAAPLVSHSAEDLSTVPSTAIDSLKAMAAVLVAVILSITTSRIGRNSRRRIRRRWPGQ
jgi:hypothetical protein